MRYAKLAAASALITASIGWVAISFTLWDADWFLRIPEWSRFARGSGLLLFVSFCMFPALYLEDKIK